MLETYVAISEATTSIFILLRTKTPSRGDDMINDILRLQFERYSMSGYGNLKESNHLKSMLNMDFVIRDGYIIEGTPSQTGTARILTKLANALFWVSVFVYKSNLSHRNNAKSGVHLARLV